MKTIEEVKAIFDVLLKSQKTSKSLVSTCYKIEKMTNDGELLLVSDGHNYFIFLIDYNTKQYKEILKTGIVFEAVSFFCDEIIDRYT